MDFILYLCSHGETKDKTVECIENLRNQRHYRFEVKYSTPDALIGRSRSIGCSKFLKENWAPYLIFIDTDICFAPEHIDRLYAGLRQGYPVIAGAYSVATGTHLAIKNDEAVTFDGGVYPFRYLSTGFMGISRTALETIRDNLDFPLLHEGDWCECYPFFESGSRPPYYISEDWDFCDKARDAGLQVYIHTGCLVGHLKERIITGQEALQKMVEKNG